MKKILKISALILLMSSVSSIVFYYYGKNSTIPVMEEKDKKINEISIKLSKTQDLYSTAAFTRDSLNSVNKLLSRYRGLTDAMSYRDSIRKPLVQLHEIGDIVYLKSDSSKVVINDILVGGGKYEHYIKYQIFRRDNSTAMISPELIYGK